VTDADIRRLMTREGKKALDLMAKDVMTVNCKRIRVDALAAEASAIFNKFRIDDLPVVDSDGRPVGMIDVQDVLAINIFG
jgi:arabinose-5-phosphate isomerase